MMPLRLLFIALILSSYSAAAEDCLLNKDGVQMSDEESCRIEMAANKCDDYFFENDVDYFSRRTCSSSANPALLTASMVLYKCAEGGLESALDVAKTIAETIVKIWDTAVANSKERSALMGYCDKSLECKRVLVKGVDHLNVQSDTQLMKMATNEIITMVNAFRESENRVGGYLRAQAGPPKPVDDEGETVLNPGVDEAKARVIVEAAKAWVASQGVKLQCSNVVGKSEMICYGIFSVVSPAGAVGWAAKLKRLAGFNASLAELRMSRLQSVGVKDGTEVADVRFLNSTDTKFKKIEDDSAFKDLRQTYLEITEAGRAVTNGTATTQALIHPEFAQELDRLSKLGVTVAVDPKINPIGITGGYYAPWAKRIGMPSTAQWTTFKHEVQHAEFDHLLESGFQSASVQVRQGKSLKDVLSPQALATYSPKEIDLMERMMKMNADSLAVNERLSMVRELDLAGWRQLSSKAIEARGYGRSFMVKYLRAVVKSGNATAAEKAALIKETIVTASTYASGFVVGAGEHLGNAGKTTLLGATAYETGYQFLFSDKGDVVVYNPDTQMATLVTPGAE